MAVSEPANKPGDEEPEVEEDTLVPTEDERLEALWQSISDIQNGPPVFNKDQMEHKSVHSQSPEPEVTEAARHIVTGLERHHSLNLTAAERVSLKESVSEILQYQLLTVLWPWAQTAAYMDRAFHQRAAKTFAIASVALLRNDDQWNDLLCEEQQWNQQKKADQASLF